MLVVFSYKVGPHGDIGGDTAYVNNNRGTRYSVEHALSRDTVLTVDDEADRALYSSDKSTSCQVTCSIFCDRGYPEP